MTIWTLTSDGAFTISGTGVAFDAWLPRSATGSPRGRAHLDLLAVPLGVVPPTRPSTLSLLDVACWIDGDRAVLRDSTGARDGSLELGARRGTVASTGEAQLEPLLTIATALLLGRLGRALVHAAAVVAPGGGVWLLVGDTHAGKSTTVATLVQGGWGWLADDQVILRGDATGVRIEGWARDPNLDEGYADGRVTGRRIGVSLSTMGVTPLRGEHPLAGILLPTIEAAAPTALTPATAADAFEALVRQSPWLLADPLAAPPLHALLMRAASTRAARLSLGSDCYRQGAKLSTVLRSVIE